MEERSVGREAVEERSSGGEEYVEAGRERESRVTKEKITVREEKTEETSSGRVEQLKREAPKEMSREREN
jgi:hypothetical protein